jgi:hypothetical protein
MLEVVTQAIARSEIASFHFISDGRFRPAFIARVPSCSEIYVHEYVWPSERDQQSIALFERAAVDYSAALRQATTDGQLDVDLLLELLADAAARGYRSATPGRRELFDVRPGSYTYLFDTTAPAGRDDPGHRLVAGWGRGPAAAPPRGRRFMRGFPLPPAPPGALDRGHLIPRAAGGDEGIGINLVPQAAALNRGRTPEGRRWRRLERMITDDPDSAVFVRALYDDASDVPGRFEYLVVTHDGLVQLDRFANRPDAP